MGLSLPSVSREKIKHLNHECPVRENAALCLPLGVYGFQTRGWPAGRRSPVPGSLSSPLSSMGTEELLKKEFLQTHQ
jgi:hypothetical protein